ncbi:secretion-regulating guanine nucleotide exchange factor [Thalictrum thalictroides]|uniref:Secretion-regulating guanine nucleotide exchange factor n=1 Tax=Thalictrum thalictroides TaxID=46969 RepID=A0A7J6UUV2_THATH|nr:secretion-regulating guanine nucleotide exchange factor [Thalictrum thalictroides]
MLRRGNKQKHRLLILSLILIFSAIFLLLSSKGKRLKSRLALSNVKWDSYQSSVQFHPTVEFRNGTDVIWQIPDLPKAVLFLAHGCNGRAVNFWDRSLSCPNCVGLPEERLIVLHALARKFAVLTISSAGRCWSFGEERVIVKNIISWWIEKNKLQKLPLVALGASSGGYFVSALATDMRFSSITLMISEGLFDKMDIPKSYPPTIFVHMPKDNVRMRAISRNMQALRQKGIDVAEIKCMEFPLTPSLLSDKIPGLDESVSVSLFNLFSEEGFIDESGHMRNDGRATQWKIALKKRKTLLSDKNEWFHHIQEELNLAFAYHEMTSLQTVQILNWFESHMS